MNRFLLASLLLAFGACATNSEPPGSVPGCEGKCDGLSGFLPLAGPDSLIRCELVASGSDQAVECEYAGVPTDFPIGVNAEVNVLSSGYTDAGGRLQPSRTGSHDFSSAETFTVLDAITDAQLPVIVLVTLNASGESLLGDAVSLSRRSDLREMSQTFTFARIGDDTPDLPLPFELWQVVVFAADGGSVRQASVGPQEVRLDPWELFVDGAVSNHEVALDVGPAPSTYWLPVDRESTQLAGRGRYCNSSNSACTDLSFLLDGPGVYKLAADGTTHYGADVLTPADAGVGMDGAVDGFAGDAGAGDAAIESDSGPNCGTTGQAPCSDGCAEGFDLDGSLCSACGTNGLRPCSDTGCADGYEQDGDFCYECGVDGQRRCASTGECAPGHRYNGSVCQVCGGDGQTYCGTSADRTCNEGHRYNGSVCQVCGGDGQTYCGTSADRTCNEGHRYNGSVCQVCGADGQTYCGTSADRTCNEGHRYNGSVCQVCGADGQTYCGTSADRTCNEGHRYNGSVCQVCGGDGQTYCGTSTSRTCNAGYRYNGSSCVPE